MQVLVTTEQHPNPNQGQVQLEGRLYKEIHGQKTTGMLEHPSTHLRRQGIQLLPARFPLFLKTFLNSPNTGRQSKGYPLCPISSVI